MKYRDAEPKAKLTDESAVYIPLPSPDITTQRLNKCSISIITAHVERIQQINHKPLMLLLVGVRGDVDQNERSLNYANHKRTCRVMKQSNNIRLILTELLELTSNCFARWRVNYC